MDPVEGGVEVFGQEVGCGDGVVAGLDFDGAVAAGGADELADAPAGAALNPAADGTSGMRRPRMNDSPAASICFWFASDTIPASATTVTPGSWWAAMNDWTTGSMVLVSALLPSNALTISGNPVWSVSRPMVICGSRRRSLENPGSRNPSAASVSKYRVDT